jgi:hypothetical protein
MRILTHRNPAKEAKAPRATARVSLGMVGTLTGCWGSRGKRSCGPFYIAARERPLLESRRHLHATPRGFKEARLDPKPEWCGCVRKKQRRAVSRGPGVRVSGATPESGPRNGIHRLCPERESEESLFAAQTHSEPGAAWGTAGCFGADSGTLLAHCETIPKPGAAHGGFSAARVIEAREAGWAAHRTPFGSLWARFSGCALARRSTELGSMSRRTL